MNEIQVTNALFRRNADNDWEFAGLVHSYEEVGVFVRDMEVQLKSGVSTAYKVVPLPSTKQMPNFETKEQELEALWVRGPIDKTAILSKPIESLLDSGTDNPE